MSEQAIASDRRAVPGDSEFDRDTAVSRREPGVYDIDLRAGWTIGNAVNGGYLLAVLGRALADALPHSDPFTVSAHYLTASRPGPAVVRTETVRTGRTLSTGQASLYQRDEHGDEVERLRVLASYGDLDALPDDVRTTATPPALPPMDQCFGPQDGPTPVAGGSAITGRLMLKLDPATLGWALGAPSGKGEMRSWFGLADGRDADPLSLLLAVDALPPTAFELGLSGWVPTVELTVHVRHRPAPGPLRVSITTRNLAGGFLEEDAEVWDSSDRLVAQSRQLARVRLGRPANRP
ncbi:thioesterase family protein [Streptomyces shenzhenensis]|uniref:TesB-like acyl-CoA thioesterase 3 n=1 Tax=Streptomyces shenzhenensis TaxID=943815 RepID=A0A3M0I7M0_9ACTN|nr:thioesterase family protein [Streptomyces shenzhenensis]RMB84322.1 TesB-like acyl-CoA thioesterase 3 [Streptomyces shenzhenensis]